jgi:CBS domain containing-hemolysin-like protein
LLILANGFFVAIEFALTRARQFSREEFVDDPHALERAWEMTWNLEIYLTTCQVGSAASSIAVGIVAESALAALFEPLFEDTALASVGDQFQAERQELALVIEDGEVVGTVTVTDTLEAVMGDIEDPIDLQQAG